MITHLYPVACPKRVADAQKDAGERVLGNLLKCETQDDANKPRTAQNGQGQSRQASNLQYKVNADQDDGYRQGPRDKLEEQRRCNPVAQGSTRQSSDTA